VVLLAPFIYSQAFVRRWSP